MQSRSENPLYKAVPSLAIRATKKGVSQFCPFMPWKDISIMRLRNDLESHQQRQASWLIEIIFPCRTFVFETGFHGVQTGFEPTYSVKDALELLILLLLILNAGLIRVPPCPVCWNHNQGHMHAEQALCQLSFFSLQS